MNKLTVLGTGTFFFDKETVASSFLIQIKGKNILVDCGPGTITRLAQAGLNVKDLDYVFITHFHSDHTSDLWPLFMDIRLTDLFHDIDNNSPAVEKFPVFFGPSGFDKFLFDMSNLVEMPAYKGWDKIEVRRMIEDIVFAKKDIISRTGFKGSDNLIDNRSITRFTSDNNILAKLNGCQRNTNDWQASR